MKDFLHNALPYWWVIFPLLAIIFYEVVLRLFGVVIIPEDKIGLVTKKFVLFGAEPAIFKRVWPLGLN